MSSKKPGEKIGQYTVVKVLGEGSFWKVYLGKSDKDGKEYAVKQLKMEEYRGNEKLIDRENQILEKMNHKNVLKYDGRFEAGGDTYIVTEYCNGGSLEKCLLQYVKKNNRKPFSVEIIQYLTKQMLEGLIYVHSQNIIHRDIKLDNILVSFATEDDRKNLNMMKAQIKLIDFGCSKDTKGAKTNTILGTPTNAAPEIAKFFEGDCGGMQMPYGNEVDIWSLGTVVYELFFNDLFVGKVRNMAELIRSIQRGDYYVEGDIPIEFLSFLDKMMRNRPRERKKAEELYRHFFIQKNISTFHYDKFPKRTKLNTLSDNNGIIFKSFGKTPDISKYLPDLILARGEISGFPGRAESPKKKEEIRPKPNAGPQKFSLVSNNTKIEQFKSHPMILLADIGQVPYMNSILYCLSNIKHLVNYFLDPSKKNIIEKNNITMADPLETNLVVPFSEVINCLWKGNPKSVFQPINFKNALEAKNRYFQGDQGYGANKLLEYLLMELHIELNNVDSALITNRGTNNANATINYYNRQEVLNYFLNEFSGKYSSIISTMFYGVFERIGECQACKFKYFQNNQQVPLRYEFNQFFQVGLNLSEVCQSFQKNNVNLIECFQYFQRQISYKGNCDLCQQNGTQFIFRTQFFSPPPILLINLNYSGSGSLTFDPLIPVKQIMPSIFKDYLNKSYSLFGAIKEISSTSSKRHFATYVVNRIDGKWYSFEENKIQEFDNTNNQIGYGGKVSCLFYKLVG